MRNQLNGASGAITFSVPLETASSPENESSPPTPPSDHVPEPVFTTDTTPAPFVTQCSMSSPYCLLPSRTSVRGPSPYEQTPLNSTLVHVLAITPVPARPMRRVLFTTFSVPMYSSRPVVLEPPRTIANGILGISEILPVANSRRFVAIPREHFSPTSASES